MAESLVKFRIDARDAIRKLRELSNATGNLVKQNLKAQKSFGGLQSVLTKLALVETGRRMTNMAATFKQTQIRLRLLSKEYGENSAAQQLAARAADKFGLSQTEALSGITDIYGRLRPIGVTLKEIETTYMGFNVATKLAGVSAQQASGAFLQLSQALGSGRLQGDEYRSIAEQLPILTQASAKEMGKPVGQIKKLASEGKITSEVVINALRKIEQEGGASIRKLMKESPEQQFKNLQNAISDLSVELGEYLIPATVAVTQALTALVRGVQDLPDPVKATAVAFAAITTAVGIGVPVLWKLFNIYRAFRIFLLRKFIPALGLTKAAFGPIALGLAALTIGIAAAGNAFVQNKRKAEKFNEALAGTDEAAIRSTISLNKETIAVLKNKQAKTAGTGLGVGYVVAAKEIAKLEKANAKLNQRLLEIPGELAAEKIQKASEAMGALKDITKQTSAQFQDAFANKMQQYGKTVNDFGSQAADIVVKSFQGMEDALVQFVQTGKMSFSDFARSIIADMTRIAIRQAVIAPLMNSFGGFLGNMFGPKKIVESVAGVAAGGLQKVLPSAVPNPVAGVVSGSGTINPVAGVTPQSGIPTSVPNIFGGNRARGGPVSAGRPYMVGERGPEMFVPNSNGKITPNNKIGDTTNVTINVDASGSSVEGDEQGARQFGMVLSAAIQQELINQRRPGGLLNA